MFSIKRVIVLHRRMLPICAISGNHYTLQKSEFISGLEPATSVNLQQGHHPKKITHHPKQTLIYLCKIYNYILYGTILILPGRKI